MVHNLDLGEYRKDCSKKRKNRFNCMCQLPSDEEQITNGWQHKLYYLVLVGIIVGVR